MSKSFYSLGLMSGTSMDGVDASVIQTDGKTKYKPILDKYFEYPKDIYIHLTKLRDKIKGSRDLKKNSKEIQNVEKEITLFHAKAVNQILKKIKVNVDFIGFHGQTIYHNAKDRISKQLGDGKLLSKITKKTVICNFRQNDLKNGGEGAPLTPIFHQMLQKIFNIKPVSFFNIGGILNRTTIWKDGLLSARDLGPGMCLIDKWIRTKTNKKYDKNGEIAKVGKVNKNVLDKYWNIFQISDPERISYDINDFDISFAKKLSLKDGAATLTLYTANYFIAHFETNARFQDTKKEKTILCGGGRKNKFLVKTIKSWNKNVKLIDDYGIDGDFVESQAFAYLAVRSYLKLPISFPETTGCKKPTTGGKIIKFK
ncbi:MAG: anhydro-N-acetylmuramic acid kinase [Candidatus Pelagibacter sp. TMED166]|nr:MAG: anhydro-N-acetylmuramic acid kinase [Candidatus Pelagibacter sp. TMED166]|tara:strand:- start:2175 stop:3281 length:1107 start_codon:yes stop_codon:yes gene_type:complete